MIALFLLFALSSATETLYWFSTPAPFTSPSLFDFRGCYGTRCVYVASSPFLDADIRITVLREDESLWAIKKFSLADPVFVVSVDRPPESGDEDWISPVSRQKFVPAVFDATPYLHSAAAPDPLVVKLLDIISEERIRKTVDHLASYKTRNSVSSEALEAAAWLEGRLRESGCQAARRRDFRSGYAPNVICEFPGRDLTAPRLVVGAHYDSRSTGLLDPAQRAPGADDNGSGVAAVLEILHALNHHKNQISLKKTITFALFAGEEQGLLGSAALAAEMKNQGTQLTAMVNLDMIGYPQRTAPTTLYWMSGSTNRPLTDLAFSLTKTYLGESTILATTGACCSDQQSFHSQGYSAASVFESLSATNNPNYHRSSDEPDTITYSHLYRNTLSAFSLIATLAEPSSA